MIPAILERYKQSETETLQYLRTETKVNLPAGTILSITNRTGQTNNWLVYWKEEITSSGYNRYVVLKMTHTITWKARDGQEYSTLAYMYGQQDNMLKDEIRSRSRMDTLYGENIKLSFFVTATNRNISKDDYFTIATPDKDGVDIIQGFRVTGFDIVSTPGIEYVSVDPIYLFNEDPTPEKTEEDSEEEEEFFGVPAGPQYRTIFIRERVIRGLSKKPLHQGDEGCFTKQAIKEALAKRATKMAENGKREQNKAKKEETPKAETKKEFSEDMDF
jgi:hypothetical protein